MNNEYCVYIHRNIINNKSYIGITQSNPPSLRWANGTHYRYNKYFNESIDKYGWNNFEHIIFENNLTLDEAYIRERMLIKLFDTTNKDKGYNISYGGTGKGMHTEETKQKIKQNHADFKGINHPKYGTKLSEETRQKISRSHIGKKMNDEQKIKRSEMWTGVKNPKAKKVRCINNNMIFTMAKEAAEWCKRDISAICKCCNKNQKSCGIDEGTGERLLWEYY